MTTTLLGITPEGASTAAVEERLYIWLDVPYEIADFRGNIKILNI